MEEKLIVQQRDQIRVLQRMETGESRTYFSGVFLLHEAKSLGNNIYRFTFPIRYENVEKVEGVMTTTVAEYGTHDPGRPFSIKCYTSDVSFEQNKAIVDVYLKVENLKVVALNIEGRIVDKPNLKL